jgi:hypothetical protein
MERGEEPWVCGFLTCGVGKKRGLMGGGGGRRERGRCGQQQGKLRVEMCLLEGGLAVSGVGIQASYLCSTYFNLEVVLRWCIAIDWWMWGGVHRLHCGRFALNPGQEDIAYAVKVLDMIWSVQVRRTHRCWCNEFWL